MADERVQRRLAAILAADVVGYSRLMGEDEAGTLAALKQLRANLIGCEAGPCSVFADPIFEVPDSYSLDFSDNLPLDPSPLFASILPIGRSVQVGEPATAFATVINAGEEAGTNCRITPTSRTAASAGAKLALSSLPW